MKAAIVIGHNPQQQGAVALDPIGHSEFRFYQRVVTALESKFVQGVDIAVVTREAMGRYSSEIADAYRQVDEWGADVSVELHFNSSDNSLAKGTETLSSGSSKSMRLARELQSSMLDTLGLRDRGIKTVTRTDRGGLSLHTGRAPAALIEPFFGSNKEDVLTVQRVGAAKLAEMIVRGIVEYGIKEGLLSESGTRKDNGETAERKPVDLTFGKISKSDWLKQNKTALAALTCEVNSSLFKQYGNDLIPLTLEDVFLIIYAEIGIKNGEIDVKHRHSQGERGLLPLPERIDRWVDQSIDPLNPAQNVEAFLRYLGGIKNADVGRKMMDGTALYRGLFKKNQTALDQAKLLAGVVHGYFYPANFDQKLPHHLIADAIRKGESPGQLLNELGYKHPPDIVNHRIENMERAMKLLKK